MVGMNALEMADELEKGAGLCEDHGTIARRVIKAAALLRQQQEKIDKYKQVLESIANEYIELSHDKIKWQCGDHIKWAKEALK
jgi:hypothetical protein